MIGREGGREGQKREREEGEKVVVKLTFQKLGLQELGLPSPKVETTRASWAGGGRELACSLPVRFPATACLVFQVMSIKFIVPSIMKAYF